MTATTPSPRNLLITAFILIVLQGSNLVGVALNRADIIHNEQRVNVMWDDYMPMWFLEGMQQNNDYRTQEIIIAITKLDPDKQKEIEQINAKYAAFQKVMLNQMIKFRGGISSTTRSAEKKNE